MLEDRWEALPARAALRFPLRVAAVDLGSNAIRFLAAEFTEVGRYSLLDYRRVAVRLGHNAFLTGALTDEAIAAAATAIASFRRRADALRVGAQRVVATSAVRESRNGSVLIERVVAETGWRIDPISGAEEARLVCLAVRGRLARQGRWLVADLGGGSLEVSVAGPDGIEWSESHTIGTVRLLEELGAPGAGGPAAYARLIDRYMHAIRLPSSAGDGHDGLAATGGNIEALSRLAGARPDAAGTAVLDVEALAALVHRLAEMSCEARIEELGLRPDRADVIVPAGFVYLRVARMAGVSTILVPGVGLIHGVLLDLVEAEAAADAHAQQQRARDGRLDSCQQSLKPKHNSIPLHRRGEESP